MAPFTLKSVALAALSFGALVARATPVPVPSILPSPEAAAVEKRTGGYKNVVYFTNWWVHKTGGVVRRDTETRADETANE